MLISNRKLARSAYGSIDLCSTNKKTTVYYFRLFFPFTKFRTKNLSEKVRRSSRVDAMEGAGEGDGFADVVEAADPGDDALDAHAEAAVRDRAVAAQVEIPLKGFFGQLVFIDACIEQLEAGDAL